MRLTLCVRDRAADPVSVHPLETLLAEVLAHDPPNVGVVAVEQPLEARFAALGQGDDDDAPAVAERLAQRAELVAAAIVECGERRRDAVDQPQHLAGAIRVAEQPRLAEDGDGGPALQRRALGPAVHLGEEAAKVGVAEALQRDRDCLADPPAGIAGEATQIRERRPVSVGEEPPETDDPADGQELLGASERSPVRPDGGPSPQSCLVGLLGDRGGELEVPPRAGKTGVLEQERLPVGKLPQGLPVLLGLPIVSDATASVDQNGGSRFRVTTASTRRCWPPASR